MGCGTRFKELLDERGMTVTTFAKLSGINRGTLYSFIRRDTDKPSLDVLIAINDILDIDAREILGLPAEDEQPRNTVIAVTASDPRFAILNELTDDELTRVCDFARGLIAGRSNRG